MNKIIQEKKQQINVIKEKQELLSKEECKLRKEIEKIIFDEKLYNTFPIKEHIGKSINKITFVRKNGTFDFFYNDEIFKIDENGYPDFSSYACGLLNYNIEHSCFMRYYYYKKTKLDYIGYVDLELEDVE